MDLAASVMEVIRLVLVSGKIIAALFCSKYFAGIISFNPYKHPMQERLLWAFF